MAKNISDATYEDEVIKSEKPVLVDFWAPWCGPCKSLSPILDALAAKHDSIKVVKVNVDENSQNASKLGVRSIPALYLYKDGEIVQQLQPMRSVADFEAALEL